MDTHRVTLPGFYTKVRPLSDEERNDLAKLPEDEAWWKEQSGSSVLTGEIGYTPTERASARPTLDVNGLLCGFTGEGSKTVLPSKAMAKISMRIVPDQDGRKVSEAFDRAVRSAIATMRFSPGMLEGRPVAVKVQIPFRFQLR